jgi:hypothetical protein
MDNILSARRLGGLRTPLPWPRSFHASAHFLLGPAPATRSCARTSCQDRPRVSGTSTGSGDTDMRDSQPTSASTRARWFRSRSTRRRHSHSTFIASATRLEWRSAAPSRELQREHGPGDDHVDHFAAERWQRCRGVSYRLVCGGGTNGNVAAGDPPGQLRDLHRGRCAVAAAV